MCQHISAAGDMHGRTFQGHFNESGVWQSSIAELSLYDLATANLPPNPLETFLRGFKSHTPGVGATKIRNFDLVSRKTVAVLLACSLVQLSGTPWLQRGLETENIFFIPNKTAANRWEALRPHILCRLHHTSLARPLAEDVAALGVLVLELETNFSAGWTDDDEDYETSERSNKNRLNRILKDWKGDLTDFYYGIGSACFLFESLVEDFEHAKVDQSMKSLAILYKCVVNPLYQKLVSDFGGTERIFRGMSGLSVPSTQKRSAGNNRIVLYDDWESVKTDERSDYADSLLRSMENDFLCKITVLRQKVPQVGLAERLKGIKNPEKMRIAVLDTGIDPTDPMIKAASPRIVQKRSWVGPPESYADNHGHGTHVTRLLLKMAPVAEIFVAKITDSKTVEAQNMNRIAEAINWAVKEWNVDIISMSFGFEDQHKAIDDAIDKAFKADKLMFAAASNEGGNKGRSRPGRNAKVMCIHACDGKGNKGAMSPSPLRNKDNFSTLGVAVPSRWKKQTVYKSGTSFATPIAAAIAADILEFANLQCGLPQELRESLSTLEGMREIFRLMSTERDGYDYVQPGHLWDGRSNDEVAKIVKDTLEEL